MTQEESSLFEVRFTERGKMFIRRFAAISYTLMVLAFFEASVTIYWSVKMLASYYGAFTSTYSKIYPYVSIATGVLTIIANLYYSSFPRILLRSLRQNDEFGANEAFNGLFKGAVVFLLGLLIISGTMIWSLMIRQF